MRKLIIIAIFTLPLLLLAFSTYAALPEEESVIHSDTDFVFQDFPEENWIVSQEMIDRLGLKPNERGWNIVVEGEDGETYGWCDILKAHMDWTEKKLEEKDEETVQFDTFKQSGICVHLINPPHKYPCWE